MTDAELARINAHRANLMRYRSLLATELTDVERAFINRRIAEERHSLDALMARTGPPLPSLATA